MSKNDWNLKELLERIEETRDEEVATVTFRGLACSRSADNLHLAISNGVIAIPIENIEDVTRLNLADQNTVAVKVRNSDTVKYLKRMPILGDCVDLASVAGQKTPLQALIAAASRSDDIKWPPIYGPGVNTSVCTTTVTDGNACDDSDCVNSDDSIAQ